MNLDDGGVVEVEARLFTTQEPTKVCCACRQRKPLSDYNIRADRGRPQDRCKPCKQAYDRAWYQRNKETHKANVTELKRRLRTATRRLIVEAKSKPCADCRQVYPPYVMDFDHVRGQKLANVSSMREESSERILEEINKCDVVCSNCHRIRTHERRAQQQL